MTVCVGTNILVSRDTTDTLGLVTDNRVARSYQCMAWQTSHDVSSPHYVRYCLASPKIYRETGDTLPRTTAIVYKINDVYLKPSLRIGRTRVRSIDVHP